MVIIDVVDVLPLSLMALRMGWTLYTEDKSDGDVCTTGSTHLS